MLFDSSHRLRVPRLQLRKDRRQAISHACIETLENRKLLSFAAAMNYPMGTNPRSVVTADFNGDGNLDLATAGSGVSVRLGNGAGGFGAGSQFATDLRPHSLAVGDFDADGKLDLAAFEVGNPGRVSVLRGGGNGTFLAPVSTEIWTESALAMAVADFNADGRSDVVYSVDDGFYGEHGWVSDVFVFVRLSDGQGGFTVWNDLDWLERSHAVGLAVGDLNADGKVDVVTANDNAGTVSVLLGNGDGTLNYDSEHPRDFAAGQSPRAVAIGDFTGDGIPDLVVAGQSVETLAGRGDGTFDAAISHPVSGSPHTAVGTGDFNSDGKRDAIVTDQSTGTVSALLGNGDGTLQAARTFAAGASPAAIAVGEFNGDGRPDAAATNAGSSNVSVLINDGNWVTATKTFVGPGGNGSGENWSNASNWSPSGAPAAGDVVTIFGRSVNLSTSAIVGGLTLTGGATLTVAQNGNRVLRTSTITIDAGSKLDLKDNDLIIDYAPGATSPLGTSNGSAYSGIAGLVQFGCNGGAWDGAHGIVTSMPQAAAGLTSIGLAEASAVLGISGTGAAATWNGQTVDASTLLLKYTYAGDANLDGAIDGGDYGIIDNFVQVPNASGYFNGDFNYDGVIDGGDYGIIDNNIQAQGARL